MLARIAAGLQALHRFALVSGVLGGQAVKLRDAERLEVGEVIAERTRLRRATARAGDAVPAGRQVLARPSGARIEVNDGASGQLGQIDWRAVGCRQRDVRQPRACEVARDFPRPVERPVRQHDKAHRHAQFPADMSPSRSSWRQPS